MTTWPIAPSTIISSVSILDFKGSILDQGSIGSCAENGLSYTLTAMMAQAGHPIDAISRMQSYNDTRIAQNTFFTDGGSSPEVMLNMAMTKGLAYESSFAYTQSNLYTVPSASVYAEAAQHKVLSYSSLYLETQYTIIVNEIKVALAEGKPVMMGFRVGDYLFNESGPLAGQVNHGIGGGSGHLVSIMACDDALNGGSLVFPNSWGAGWGDGGVGSIRYDQLNVSAHPGDLLGLYVINGFNGIDFTFTQHRTDIAKLYVALLNRAPDHSGQDWWAATMSANHTAANVANELLKCSEESLIYPTNSTSSDFISRVYVNTLGRAADTEGLAFWSSAIDHGSSRGAILNEILDLTMNYVHGSNVHDSEGIYSQNLLNNKVAVAMHFGVTYQSDNLPVAQAALIGVTDNYNSVNTSENSIAHQLHIL